MSEIRDVTSPSCTQQTNTKTMADSQDETFKEEWNNIKFNTESKTWLQLP